MSTRMTVRGFATLAGVVAFVLSVFSGVVRGDGDASTIRWDIQHYPNLVLQPGGEAFADAVDGSKIRSRALVPLRPMGIMSGVEGPGKHSPHPVRSRGAARTGSEIS
jgi:hypothetical protein